MATIEDFAAGIRLRDVSALIGMMFEDNPPLVHAVNQLLVIGFYLVPLGWAFLLAKGAGEVATIKDAVALLVNKRGILLLLLGAAHLTNLYVFHRIKQGAACPAPR